MMGGARTSRGGGRSMCGGFTGPAWGVSFGWVW